MIRRILLSIIVLAIHSLSFARMTTYIDGNNNAFKIYPEKLIYDPVSAAESSSGEYDGGEAKTVPLDKLKYESIIDLIESILKNKNIQISGRTMGCGTIIHGKKTCYISMDAVEKSELENLLRSFLN